MAPELVALDDVALDDVALDDPAVGTQQLATRSSGFWRRLTGMSLRPILLAAILLMLYLWQQVQLSLVATALTIVIAVPLGILLTRPFARWIKPIGLGLGNFGQAIPSIGLIAVSYTHLRAHETVLDLVCRLLL